MMILDDLSIRSGAASHHDDISPHLRPGPRLQRVRAHGDGRDFLPRGTFSHPRDQVIRNDVSDTQLQIYSHFCTIKNHLCSPPTAIVKKTNKTQYLGLQLSYMLRVREK